MILMARFLCYAQLSHKKLFTMTIFQFPQFSPEAAKLWEEIPVEFQEEILDNVFCSHCRDAVRIIDYSGSVVSGDLRLKGNCAICGNQVARLVEGS
jgi:hypothetical protein